MVEEGIREQGEELERAERAEKPRAGAEPEGAVAVGDRVRLASGGAGQVLERPGRTASWSSAMGAMKMVVDADQATRTAGGRPAQAERAARSPRRAAPAAPRSRSTCAA